MDRPFSPRINHPKALTHALAVLALVAGGAMGPGLKRQLVRRVLGSTGSETGDRNRQRWEARPEGSNAEDPAGALGRWVVGAVPPDISDRREWVDRGIGSRPAAESGGAGTGVAPSPTADLETSPGPEADDFDRLAPTQRDMVVRLLTGSDLDEDAQIAGGPRLVPELCFAPGTPSGVTRAFHAARTRANARRRADGFAAAALQLASRWNASATATGGASSQKGDPITLTWSLVPDGTNIPGDSGEPDGPSDLRAWLNARYGSEEAWLPLFAQVFERWSELSGATYVYEPQDDGGSFPTTRGSLGVRGDIRISGHPIDGNSGVVAYNHFPQNGDMVIDTGDIFFANVTNNSEKLRTTIAHEHGHGLGLRHVCPSNSTKLMEPFVSSSISGPQLDDIYSVQRLYGDRFEPSNSPAAAVDLGALTPGNTVIRDVSVDDNSDVDFYRFTPSGGGGLLSATVRPVGASYLEGPQNSDGSCSAGTLFDALTVHNLALELRDADGTTVLMTTNAAPAGQPESIGLFALPTSGGPYFLRVSTASNTDNAQLYQLELELVDTTTPRTVSVADAVVSETTGAATITLSVTPTAWQAIEVPWATVGGTATPEADFAPAADVALIPAGAGSVHLIVPLVDDPLDEGDESFGIQFTAPANATLPDGTATVTIVDDDPAPILTVTPTSTSEGSGAPMLFTASLSSPSGRAVSADWKTLTTSATQAQPDADYAPAAGTVTFAPGETARVLDSVTVIDDTLAERDETFSIVLSNPVNTVLGTSTIIGRIYDDEALAALAETGSFAAPTALGQPVVAWQAVVGRRYRVESSPDLLSWSPLPGSSTLIAQQAALSFTDTSPDTGRKYYRVVDLPP